MDSPIVPNTYFTERAGVNAVAKVANEMHCVWRETSNGDVGIDGQLELCLETGEATNFIVAAQVKSGSSYFHWRDGVTTYRPEPKHREYWRAFPLPVLLILHDPESGLSFWEDVRRVLRSPEGERSETIRVPSAQTFCPEQRQSIFLSCGPEPKPLLTTEELARRFVLTKHRDPGFPVSFCDLFLLGVVDIGFQLFFSMHLVMDIVEFNLAHSGAEHGWGLGSDEYDFLDFYIRILVQQRLINLDFSAYLNCWHDRQMVPTFVVPFTSRGRELLQRLESLAVESIGEAGGNVVRERIVRIGEPMLDYDRFISIAAFQQKYREKTRETGTV